VGGGDGAVKSHARDGGNEGAEERGAGNRVDRQAEDGHEKGGHHRPAADAVGSPDDAHPQGEEEQGHGAERVALLAQAELQVKEARSDPLQQQSSGHRIRLGLLRIPRAEHVIKEASSHREEHEAHEDLEPLRVRKNPDPEKISREDSRHGARGDDRGQGPVHPALPHVTQKAAGDAHDVVDEVRGAHRGADVSENAHLKGKDEEGPGEPAHGGEEGD
jgi:hypothetical protein